MILESYYLVINIISFFLFYIDKRKAQIGSWRFPEKTLLLVSFLGGGVGAQLAMQAFRHKTKKAKFKILVPLSIILHIYLYIEFFDGFLSLG